MLRLLLSLVILSTPALAVDLITSQTLGTYRFDFTGQVGARAHWLQTVTTTDIGYWCDTSDTSIHTVKVIYENRDNKYTDVSGSSAAITCPGGTSAVVYAARAFTLTKGNNYMLAASVASGVHGFYSGNSTITTTGVAMVMESAYYTDQWNIIPGKNAIFGPVYLRYTAPTPLTTVDIQSESASVTSVTRYGVKNRAPQPSAFKFYVTGPNGCTIAGTEDASALAGTFWEDGGQTYLSAMTTETLPRMFYLRFHDWDSFNGAVGILTSTLTFTLGGSGCSGSGTLTVTLNMSNGRPLPQIVYRTSNGAAPSICTNTGGLWRDANQCDYASSDGMNSSSPIVMRSRGDSGTDAAWGHTIRKMTSGPEDLSDETTGQSLHSYSAVTAYSRSGLNFWSEKSNGSETGSSQLIRISDLTLLRNNQDLASNYMIPSTIYEGTVEHRTDGHTIRKTVMDPVTGITVSTEDYEMNTAPFFITTMDHGGTSDMTSDGWWAFIDDGGDRVCAVNMAGITTSNYLSHVYCGPLGDAYQGSARANDTAHVTQRDRRTGERYVAIYGFQHVAFYAVNVGAQRLDYWITPEAPDGLEQCNVSFGNGDGHWQLGECGMPAGHSDFVEWDGGQYWVAVADFNTMNERWQIAVDISAGPDMFVPVEFGGGLYMLNRLGTTGSVDPAGPGGPDNHESCAWSAGICAWSYFEADSFHGQARTITNITAGNPAILTTVAHPWSAGSKTVVVGGLLQPAYRSCAMGKFAATVTDSTHITLTGANCTGAGTYTDTGSTMAIIGEVISNTVQAYGNEIQLGDLHHIVRAINARNYLWDGFTYDHADIHGYRSFPEASLSQDGANISFHSTTGIPEIADYMANTGWTASSAIRPVINPTHNGGVVALNLPTAQSCSWTVYADAATTVQTATSLSSTVHNLVLTGEAESTNYLLRATCGVYSATVPFKTLASPSGTAAVSVIMLGTTGASTIVYDYGATTSLGSTSGSTSCASGAQCTATASPNRGLLYVQGRIRNSGGTTITTGPLTALRN